MRYLKDPHSTGNLQRNQCSSMLRFSISATEIPTNTRHTTTLERTPVPVTSPYSVIMNPCPARAAAVTAGCTRSEIRNTACHAKERSEVAPGISSRNRRIESQHSPKCALQPLSPLREHSTHHQPGAEAGSGQAASANRATRQQQQQGRQEARTQPGLLMEILILTSRL